jgi:hypothetical protein
MAEVGRRDFRLPYSTYSTSRDNDIGRWNLLMREERDSRATQSCLSSPSSLSWVPRPARGGYIHTYIHTYIQDRTVFTVHPVHPVFVQYRIVHMSILS